MPEHHRPHRPFGNDRFGLLAERFARFFGTPKFILGQTALVILWIVLNALAVGLRWDPYPFILLNLAFSTQSAYAAPLILLAQTRQSDRDNAVAADRAAGSEAREKHAEAQGKKLHALLEANTKLTEQVEALTERIERAVADMPRNAPKPE